MIQPTVERCHSQVFESQPVDGVVFYEVPDIIFNSSYISLSHALSLSLLGALSCFTKRSVEISLGLFFLD